MRDGLRTRARGISPWYRKAADRSPYQDPELSQAYEEKDPRDRQSEEHRQARKEHTYMARSQGMRGKPRNYDHVHGEVQEYLEEFRSERGAALGLHNERVVVRTPPTQQWDPTEIRRCNKGDNEKNGEAGRETANPGR
jgi:hypothetical protein